MATPFKQRSQGSSFKMMGSSSPMQKDGKAMSAYQSGTKAMQKAVNAGATGAELRAMVVSHNKSVRGMKNAGKAKISYANVKAYKRQKPVVEEKETVVLPTPREKDVKKVKQGTYVRDVGFMSPDSFLSK